MMRVAALYDIHGNLPALEAALQGIRQADVDRIVVGGDVVPGPMPRETLSRLLDLDVPTHFIYGNGELAILAQIAGARTGSVSYWDPMFNCAGHFTILPKPRNAFGARGILRQRTLPCRAC